MAAKDTTSSDDGEGLDLRGYVDLFRRRWYLTVGSALALGVLLLGFALVEQPTYKASAEVLIGQGTTDDLLQENRVATADAARRLNNEVRVLESAAVAKAVDERYEGPLDPFDVDASVVDVGSDVVDVSVTGPDAEDVAELINLYVTTFVEVRQQQRINELGSAGSEVQAKLDEIDAQLDQVRSALEANEGDEALQAELDSLESSEEFYDNELRNLQLTTGLARAGGAEVLTPAEAPEDPIAPKPVRNAIIGLVLGLLLGAGVTIVVDILDDRLHGTAEFERATRLPAMALVPPTRITMTSFVAVRDEPQSAAAEAFRLLRTGVKFAGLQGGSATRILQITSPGPGEGKSTAAANLAVALAQGGDRVALVCCDLRRPTVQERFGRPRSPGFTDVVLGERTLDEVLVQDVRGMSLVPAGSPVPNPSEVLSSAAASTIVRQLAEDFDVVVVDSTPILPVTDALVTSRFVDSVLLVADVRMSRTRSLERALQLLHNVEAPLLGLILNRVPIGGREGYGYGYGYGYGERRTDDPRVVREPSRPLGSTGPLPPSAKGPSGPPRQPAFPGPSSSPER